MDFFLAVFLLFPSKNHKGKTAGTLPEQGRRHIKLPGSPLPRPTRKKFGAKALKPLLEQTTFLPGTDGLFVQGHHLPVRWSF